MSLDVADEFDPHYKWLGIPPSEQPPNHYRLLGVVLFEPDRDVIAAAADRQMAHVKSFATGRYARESQTLLNELARARICLLNPEHKARYDDQLRRQQLARSAAADPAPSAGGQPTPPDLPMTQARPATPKLDEAPMIRVHPVSRRRRRHRSPTALLLWILLLGGCLVAVLLLLIQMASG